MSLSMHYRCALVVDDDPILVEVASSLLRLYGFREILKANDGVVALELLERREKQVDLILCDLQMPNMDGVAFMRSLGALHFPGAVAIVSSMSEGVLSLASQLAKSHGLNFLGVVKKPLTKARFEALTRPSAPQKPPAERGPEPEFDEAALRKAIENREIVAFYQPKLEVASGRIIGAEALARWRRPDGTLVAPDRFIPLAEKTGLISALDQRIMSHAVADLAVLRNLVPALAISVNASAVTLSDLELFDFLTGLMATYRLDPSALVLEITESQALDKTASLIELLCRLRLAGFELSIDDFGTGHSNLGALHDFPFTELKIDRSFVMNALVSKRANASVESCLLLGREMGMHVVAEGVETAQHWQLLEQNGAAAAQGYYIARPMPLSDFVEWIKARTGPGARKRSRPHNPIAFYANSPAAFGKLISSIIRTNTNRNRFDLLCPHFSNYGCAPRGLDMRFETQKTLEKSCRSLRRSSAALARDQRGSIAVIFAIIAPLLSGIIGLAMDYGLAANQKAILQRAADAAALAGAKELSMSDAKRESVASAVESMVETFVKENLLGANITPDVHTEMMDQTVEVSVVARYKSIFGDTFGLSVDRMKVTAVARIAGQPNICVLSLESRELGAIALSGRAHLVGRDCSVFSNSRSSSGVTVTDGANLKATTVCSAGGVLGENNVEPSAYVDCPQFDDPLASRPEPDARSCDHLATVILSQKRTLNPGVYCLGLTIAGLSDVTFNPGIYVIKNGPLLVAAESAIRGKGVGFYLSGASFFTFDPLTTIELEAPTSGSMAGLLFFGSRSQSKLLINTILSSNAQVMLGTIYLPQTSLLVTSLAKVGSKSAYTAIVARRLVMLDGPELVLNSNYEETDVPVPDGIRGAGQPVSLVK